MQCLIVIKNRLLVFTILFILFPLLHTTAFADDRIDNFLQVNGTRIFLAANTIKIGKGLVNVTTAPAKVAATLGVASKYVSIQSLESAADYIKKSTVGKFSALGSSLEGFLVSPLTDGAVLIVALKNGDQTSMAFSAVKLIAYFHGATGCYKVLTVTQAAYLGITVTTSLYKFFISFKKEFEESFPKTSACTIL